MFKYIPRFLVSLSLDTGMKQNRFASNHIDDESDIYVGQYVENFKSILWITYKFMILERFANCNSIRNKYGREANLFRHCNSY